MQSQGEGGDDTTAIEAAAERVILARFEGVDALVAQMADDVARSRDLLGVPQPSPASGP